MSKQLKITIISDGTGETAKVFADATLAQFGEKDIAFTRHLNVRSREQIDAIFDRSSTHNSLVLHTLVTHELRQYIAKLARVKHIRSIDLLGPVLNEFANFFDQEPSSEPGLHRAVNDDYFERVGAVQFTINHDDGRSLRSLALADIVFVGISRTSKTPLSVYVSQQYAVRVANIPIIMGAKLPKELFEVDQRKVFALTIDPDALYAIRRNRLSRLGAEEHTGDYATMDKVAEEIEWANSIFKENKKWIKFDVTNKAIEETAAEVKKLLNKRENNIFL